MSPRAQRILWLDSGAAASAGLLMLTLQGWLAPLYGFPLALVRFMAAANLTYALYSGSLALRARRIGRLPRLRIDALVLANLTWTCACAAMVFFSWPWSRAFGVAQLVAEGLFVAGLAVLELRLVRPETQ